MVTSHESKREDWKAVQQAEWKEILKRRRAVDESVPNGGDEEAAEQCQRSSVGLALSGGGIRSASFNLGLLQALHEARPSLSGERLLRYVDYLATVSGGGFVGGFLASRVHWGELASGPRLRPGSRAEAADSPKSPRDQAELLAPSHTGKQPKRVLRLIHGGQYLARPLRFFNRYLIGVFLLNLLVFSGVIAVTTLAALLFRCLDLPWVMEWLNAIGFRDDVTRALAPSAVLFIAWLSAWVVSFWRDRSRAVGRVAQILAALLIV